MVEVTLVEMVKVVVETFVEMVVEVVTFVEMVVKMD